LILAKKASVLNDLTLTALAVRARNGDTDAATLLVRHTQHQVHQTLSLLTRRAAIEDLTQETYARAFAELHRFHTAMSVRAWLLSIARHVATDTDTKTHTHPPDSLPIDDDPDPAKHRTLEQAVARNDQSEYLALRAVLDELEHDRRVAFLLTQIVGLSYAEAAQVCHCPVGTIRSRVARARNDLIHHLTERPSASQSG
jgi:RNA polymerase sigma-70 factor (ECF subfamily)